MAQASNRENHLGDETPIGVRRLKRQQYEHDNDDIDKTNISQQHNQTVIMEQEQSPPPPQLLKFQNMFSKRNNIEADDHQTPEGQSDLIKKTLKKSINDDITNKLTEHMRTLEQQNSNPNLIAEHEDQAAEGEFEISRRSSLSSIEFEVPDDKEEIDEIMENRDQQKEGTIFSLIFMVLFIVHFIMEIRIEAGTGIISILNRSLFTKQYLGISTSLQNVTNIDQLELALQFLTIELFTDIPFDYQYVEKLNIRNTSNDKKDESIFRMLQDSEPDNSTTDPESNNNFYAMMIKKYTYFMGMRITTNNAYMLNNTDSNSKEVLPSYRSKTYQYATDQIDSKSVNKSMGGAFNYRENGGYEGRGGFVQYFNGNQSLTSAKQQLNSMLQGGWFRNNMVQTVLEAMFYNKNTELGVIMQIKFFKSNSGQFSVRIESQLFLPQNYDEFNQFNVIKLVLFSGSSLGVFLLLIKIALALIYKFKQSFIQRSLTIEWYTYIDISVVCICMTSIVLWFTIFINTRGKFRLPLQDESNYQHWCDISDKLRTYLRVSAMCIVLMCIRNLRVLTTQFPAFGVLFDTIRKAKSDLIFFFIFAFILALSAVCLSMGFFGQYEKRFTSVNDTIMTLFQMMFGKIYYLEMVSANETLGPIFFYPFMFAFFFIVLSFFSAIIMRTYDDLRQKKQLVTEAMAMILTKETQKQKAIWINLICCRIKQHSAQEEDEYQESSSSSEEEDTNHSDEDKQNTSHKAKARKRKSDGLGDLSRAVTGGLNDFLKEDDGNQGQGVQQDPSLSAKILYNLNQIKNIVRGNQFKTREQFEEQLRQTKKYILQRKKKEIRRRKMVFTNASSRENYQRLKESLIYLVYIIIFVVMILYQTNNTTSQKAGWPIRKLLRQEPFTQQLTLMKMQMNSSELEDALPYLQDITFDQIEDSFDMIDFVDQKVYPFVYGGVNSSKQFNVAIGQYYLRLTFRFANNTINTDADTNTIFKGKHNAYNLDRDNLGQNQYDEIVGGTININNGTLRLNYTQAGNPGTSYDGVGGYTILLEANKTSAMQKLQYLYPVDWLYYGLSMLAIDFVVYNPHYQKYVYYEAVFEIDGAGFVVPSMSSSSLYLNHFQKKNTLLIIIELIYVLFNIYYFILLLQNLRRIWHKVSRNDPNTKNQQQSSSRFVRMVIYIGIDYRKFERKSFVIILFRILLGLVLFMVRLLFKVVRVLYIQIGKSVFTGIDFVQLVLSTQIIIVWIKIIAIPNYDMINDYTEPNIIPSANQLTNYQEYYRLLCHFNAFITFLRILQFFTFSKKLSAFTEVIFSAKYDFLFFILMFAFIIFGYAVAGYGIYGGSIADYRTIFLAAMQLIRTLLLDFNYTRMYQADSVISAVFFVSFIIIFKLALLNMFVAIIVAHYNQFQRESKDTEQISFFRVVLNILRNNMFKKRNNGQQQVTGCWQKCLNTQKVGEYLFGNTNNQENAKEEHVKQQQQSNTIQKVLSQRVQQPVFQDYKIHYGMKSYFRASDPMDSQSNKQPAIKGAQIFQRIQQNGGYQEHDFNNANFWLYNLEENLAKQTNGMTSIYDFHSDDNLYSDLMENFDPSTLNSLQKEYLMLDKNRSQRLDFFTNKATRIYEKYDLWKGMDFEKCIKILCQNENDFGLLIMKLNQQRNSENSKEDIQELKKVLQNVQFKEVIKSVIYNKKFNKVSKMQHYLWTQVLAKEEKYLLWFEIFNAQDRVRLWNTLVFSENYFNFVAMNSKYKRKDLKDTLASLKQQIQAKISQKEQKLLEKATLLAKSGRKSKLPKTLTRLEQLRVRDKHFTADTMLTLWDSLKQRRFTYQQQTVTLGRKEYYEMISSMFKIMVCGISNDNMKLINKHNQARTASQSKIEIYKKLKNEIYEDTEYRLSLWLPLSLNEKLDMMLHQRNEDEMEIMMFLLDQEYDLSTNIGNSDKLDILIERSLDAQVFQKYQNCARYQALKKSLHMCKKRLDQVFSEDKQLLEYTVFIKEKTEEYQSVINQLRSEMHRTQKRNEKLHQQINQDHKLLRQEMRQVSDIPTTQQQRNAVTSRVSRSIASRQGSSKKSEQSIEEQDEEGHHGNREEQDDRGYEAPNDEGKTSPEKSTLRRRNRRRM